MLPLHVQLSPLQLLLGMLGVPLLLDLSQCLGADQLPLRLCPNGRLPAIRSISIIATIASAECGASAQPPPGRRTRPQPPAFYPPIGLIVRVRVILVVGELPR